MKYKWKKISYILCFSDYFRHLWNYNVNKNHVYCVFRIILDTYGIIMRNKYHIYCVFPIILDTYGIIMRNKYHIYRVFRIILDIYGIIMKINIMYIVYFGLF